MAETEDSEQGQDACTGGIVIQNPGPSIPPWELPPWDPPGGFEPPVYPPPGNINPINPVIPPVDLPKFIFPSLPPGSDPTLPIRLPGFPGLGGVTIPGLRDLINGPVDPGEIEEWQEIARTSSTVDVSGVIISRMETVTFERPNGAKIKLNFNN